MPQLPLIWGIPFLVVLCFVVLVVWKTHQYYATPVAALAQDSSLLRDRDRGQVVGGRVDI